MKKKVFRNTVMLVMMMLVIILLPFFLLHNFIDGLTAQVLKNTNDHPLYTALLLFLLLASDILLPVPSSMVSIGAGFLLGFINGTIISFSGMTLGCLLGYQLGKGSWNKMNWLHKATRNNIENFFHRFGKWSVIIARPIPVLAEASVFFAGMNKMNFRTFMFTSSLSNLGISMVYSAVGSYSVSLNSTLLAFVAAIILPGIALFVEKFYRMRIYKMQTGAK